MAYVKVESQSFVSKCDLGSTTLDNGFETSEKIHNFLKLFFDLI